VGEITAGAPYPLGASWDGTGTTFAVYSEHAEQIDLCLLHDDGGTERIPLPEVTHHVWHARVAGVGPGQRYGFRADGPWDPGRGLRFNPAKLLTDPYARALDGDLVLDPAVFGHRADDGSRPDLRDSAPHVPHSVVVDPAHDWHGDRPPRVPWADTVIYEAHVRGLTMRHPDVPQELRGTYAGLAHPAVVEHLQSLGVTTVELLPVHHFVSEPALLRRGLTNYWGYNTLGFFAPHARYSASGSRGQQVGEFREMVRALHSAGLEVVLDVVFNHTAEGDAVGPTLSWRGLDNPTYYRLRDSDPGDYVDDTGCGNTLNARHPAALQLVLDSLRYWVREMHVDGFRFDLAVSLARTDRGFDRWAPFFHLVGQDPALAGVKLIAEPWDVGPGGYQAGHFPPRWTEWNPRYRDTVRDVWRGERRGVAELASRLAGSGDVFDDGARRPWASVNFVTAHDGFTLRDLVSYEHKHNEANGEGNRDGTDDNRSASYGPEGETDDPAVRAVRRRQQRNLLATLLLSVGVPMLLAGDELDRTQQGNNNAYCQDGPLSWLDWQLDGDGSALLEWTRALLRVRRDHPVLRRRSFLLGREAHSLGAADVAWFTAGGTEMTEPDWHEAGMATLGMLLVGDPGLYLLVHAGLEPVDACLPGRPWADRYELLLDTSDERPAAHPAPGPPPGFRMPVPARTVRVLRVHR
jgi:isoamylase